MSTSLLYHGFGIHDHTYKRTEFAGGAVTFHIVPKPRAIRCPICRTKKVTCRGVVHRFFRTIPIGAKPVWLRVPIQRVWCPKCRVVRQTTTSFAEPKKRYTKHFKRYVLELSRWMTIQAVANHVGVSWDVVKDIQKQRLWRLYRKPRLKGLKEIAIDEISIGKGHKYLTLVLDLRTGRVVFVGDGKGAEALQPFWTRLKKSRARIQAVAIDMSNAYIQAVTENIPEAKIVFDRFHIVKMFNDKITEYRRQLFNRLKDPTERKLLKGTRWLLLKNPENLNPEKDERERLDQALEVNKPLATIYYMNDDLRQYWNQANRASAAAFLQDWIQRAKASGIKVLEKFADTLIAHRDGILAYYDYPITTAPLEGTNNKIKTMKRQAYGFRDKEFFKLKIMGIHETKYALVG